MEANWIDIFCGSVFLILSCLGLYFGLAKTLIHLVAWVSGALGVIYAPEFLGPFLVENFNFSETATIILARVLGFLLPFLVLRIIGHFINKFIKRHLSFPNAIAGGILGLVKGLIPCLILLSTLYLLPLSGNLERQRDSSLAYSLYAKILRDSGVEEKITSVQDSIQSKITDKINETIDSSKVKISKAASESIQNRIDSLNIPKR